MNNENHECREYCIDTRPLSVIYHDLSSILEKLLAGYPQKVKHDVCQSVLEKKDFEQVYDAHLNYCLWGAYKILKYSTDKYREEIRNCILLMLVWDYKSI